MTGVLTMSLISLLFGLASLIWLFLPKWLYWLLFSARVAHSLALLAFICTISNGHHDRDGVTVELRKGGKPARLMQCQRFVSAAATQTTLSPDCSPSGWPWLLRPSPRASTVGNLDQIPTDEGSWLGH